MKKTFLSIMIMLCLCLAAGCSTEKKEKNASAQTPETQEDSLKKDEPQTEDDLTDSNPPQTQNDLADSNAEKEIKNNNVSEPSTPSSPEEVQATATAGDYYKVCTSLPAQDVENYAGNIRSFILSHDWNSLAEELFYPITINGTTCSDSAAFLALDIDSHISPEFLNAIEAETCQQMFCNWQGISMGAEGQIWIEEKTGNDGNATLKVTALNNLLN